MTISWAATAISEIFFVILFTVNYTRGEIADIVDDGSNFTMIV